MKRNKKTKIKKLKTPPKQLSYYITATIVQKGIIIQLCMQGQIWL